MHKGEWKPTVVLAIDAGGQVVQQWVRPTIEYRLIGGTQRGCKGYEYEWRELPLKSTFAESRGSRT